MPNPFFTDFLDELRARVEIEDCIKRFIRGIDRQDWKLARSTYHDDAIDEHGFFCGPPDKFLAMVARLHEHQTHSMHVMSNMLIEFTASDRALVETYCLVFQRFDTQDKDVPPGSLGLRKTATSRYIDVFEQRDGEWRVVRRNLVFGDIQSEPMTAPLKFPASFTVQQHSMQDCLYQVRASLT
jgi:SnoaL-like domain